jgi:hypothetical protein
VITAETVSSIRTFDSGGCQWCPSARGSTPVSTASGKCTRVPSLLDEIRPLAKDGIGAARMADVAAR